MKHLINKLTGGDMWVADNREKEYLEAGHKPVSITAKPEKPVEKVEKKEDPKEKKPVPEKPRRSRKK